MGSEEWRRKQKKASTPLATWADNNGVPRRIAGLVADGQASARVVDILKKGRAIGATLSSAQRTALMGQLRGAWQWHKDGTDAPASGARRKPAAATAPTFRRRAALPAETTPAPVQASRPRRRARRAAGPVVTAEESAAEMVASHADVEIKGAETVWTCLKCTTPHDYDGKQCKFCGRRLLRWLRVQWRKWPAKWPVSKQPSARLWRSGRCRPPARRSSTR